MAGRPRKPTKIKELAGTARKHRENPSEPEAPTGYPDCPDWLSSAAARIFDDTCRSLDSMGILSPQWADVIAAYASCQEEIEIYSAIIAQEGRTYTTTTQTGDTMYRARPEVAMRADAMRRAQQLRSEIGLGPASKSKVSANSKHEMNPFEDL